MKHQCSGFKLNRRGKHRTALLMNLSRSLVLAERIETTVAKAKAFRPWIEKMITQCKKNDYHRAFTVLASRYRFTCEEAFHKLYSIVVPRYKERPGGFVRIVKTGFQKGDGAPLCQISFVE
jgi:large subunit ribosomal protein L17